jgi:glutamate-ammonia-ligase adenylyltransferase
VQFSALEHYYRDQAWTWELQALTRLRPVAGDPCLMAHISDMKARVLVAPRDADKVRADILAMREKMTLAHPIRGAWDIKRQAGGLIDLEFLSQ